MEFEKETSFIHVDGEKILIFAIAVLLILLIVLLINIGKVSITRAGNMSF